MSVHLKLTKSVSRRRFDPAPELEVKENTDMTIEILVPDLPESVADATVATAQKARRSRCT